MRTIGRKNRNLVTQLAKEAKKSGLTHYNHIFTQVKEKLPVEIFSTWEGAYTEIENICTDIAFSDD